VLHFLQNTSKVVCRRGEHNERKLYGIMALAARPYE